MSVFGSFWKHSRRGVSIWLKLQEQTCSSCHRYVIISDKAKKDSDCTIDACWDNLFDLSDDTGSKHNLRRSGRTCSLGALGAPLIKIEPDLHLYSDNYHVHKHTGHRRATLIFFFLFIQISLHKNNHRGVVTTLNMEKWDNGVRWWLLVLNVIAQRNPACEKIEQWHLSLIPLPQKLSLGSTCLNPSFPIRQFYCEATHKCKWPIFLLSITL